MQDNMSEVNFSAVENTTIWDVVNNTYGTSDKVVKLMRDNNIPNVNDYPEVGDIYSFDDTLVENQNNIQSNLALLKFATRDRTITNDNKMVKYEQNFPTEFTSNLDGTTVIPLSGLIPAGARIVQIEKEIKPLKSNQWTFNPSSVVLTLIGTTADNGQTLFIIYAVTITS